MKKLGLIFLAMSLAICFAQGVYANTVTIEFEGFNALLDSGKTEYAVSGFELYFFDKGAIGPNDTAFGFPFLEDDGFPPKSRDIDVTPGPGMPYPEYWYYDEDFYYDVVDDGSVNNIYVRAVIPAASLMNTANSLRDGIVLAYASSTFFGINIDDPSTVFFNFEGDFGEVMDLHELGITLDSRWEGENQLVTVSAVPIPSTLLLLGGGLAGLVGLRRRNRS